MIYDPTQEKLNKEIAKATDRVYWRGSFYDSFSQAPLCPCGNPECKGH